jgi:hypothetical protein
MTDTHPDLLLRFVPTPYTCTLLHAHSETRVESNSQDLIAALREYPAPHTPLQAVAHLKIIVDDTVAADGDALTHVDSVHLHTLLRGTTTILIYDRESLELLAFLSPQISCTELLNRLLPATISGEPVTELQTRDMGTIAP